MRRLAPWGAAALFAAGAALVALPVKLLWPMAPQTPASLAIAYRLRLWNPSLSLLLLAAGIALVAWGWPRGRSRLLRALALVPLAGLLAVAAAARFNHFQYFFHPAGANSFRPVAEVDFLEPEEMVLAVTIGGEARAYPVGMLAYHHLVNDVVAGVAFVATY